MTTAHKIPPQTTRLADTEPSSTELDENSLSAIRSILTEEPDPASRRTLQRSNAAQAPAMSAPDTVRRKADSLPELQSVEEELRTPLEIAATAPKRRFSLRRKAAVAMPKTLKEEKPQNAAPNQSLDGTGLMDRARAYRPTVSHIVLACIVVIVFMRPWLVFGLLILFAFAVVGVFLITGYDGFWRGVVKVNRWYARRRPSRAAALHERLDRFAVRWDSILDRFPEGTVDGLYLPDFGDLANADARHNEALERRLVGMQEERG